MKEFNFKKYKLRTLKRGSFLSKMLVLILLVPSIVFAKITVEVEPSTVRIDETVRLTLTNDAANGSGVPNLVPLESNFTIVSTEQSMSYTAVNGQARAYSQWSILLRPKKTGILAIPAFKFGAEQSLPTQVVVLDETSTNQQKNTINAVVNDKIVVLEAEVSNAKPYINEEVIYTIKFYNNQRLINIDFRPPRVQDALLISLGEGRHYQTVYKGNRVNVEEQKYAIFPQKSGKLEIEPPSLNALIYDFVPTPINTEAKGINLQVLKAKDSIPADQFLPAKDLTISEHFSKMTESPKVGLPLTRTIIIKATATMAELLPKLDFINTKEFSVYPEKAKIKNEIKQGEIEATVTVPVTYILNKSGDVTLPAINITWFNTSTNEIAVATLPKKHILVEAKVGEKIIPKVTNNPIKLLGKTRSTEIKKFHFSFILCIILIAVILLFSIIIWVFMRNRHKIASINNSEKNNSQIKDREMRAQSFSTALQELRKSCQLNDKVAAKNQILAWAAENWPEVRILNLSDLVLLVDDNTLQSELNRLSEALYALNKEKNWDGDALLQAVLAYKTKPVKAKSEHSALPPINP